MTSLETIKAKISEINAKKQELVADLRKDFAPILKPLFEKSNGKIKSFGWTQYNPYFNDGDECEFGVNIDYPYINGENVYDIESLDWRIEYYLKDGRYSEEKTDEWDIELFKLIQELKSALSEIDSEFLKALFGDHVLVTVHDDGTIETEEYEHD